MILAGRDTSPHLHALIAVATTGAASGPLVPEAWLVPLEPETAERAERAERELEALDSDPAAAADRLAAPPGALAAPVAAAVARAAAELWRLPAGS